MAWIAEHWPRLFPRDSVGWPGRVARREEGAVAAVHGVLADSLFNQRLWARTRERVVCIGDSHTKVMCQVNAPGYWFRTLFVDGATASGVTNPNSATHAMMLFTRRLRLAKPWQRVVVLLGEVDCGFVIWHRADRHGLTLDDQLEETLTSYSEFLRGIVAAGFREVVALSAPAPTIGDDPVEWGEVANLRSEVSASQLERTQLTQLFNERLRARCEDLGVTFVDVTSQQIDPGTGVISSQYLRATSEDHHLADAPYAALIARELAAHWDAQGRSGPNRPRG